jgi:hypothetical protein
MENAVGRLGQSNPMSLIAKNKSLWSLHCRVRYRLSVRSSTEFATVWLCLKSLGFRFGNALKPVTNQHLGGSFRTTDFRQQEAVDSFVTKILGFFVAFCHLSLSSCQAFRL